MRTRYVLAGTILIAMLLVAILIMLIRPSLPTTVTTSDFSVEAALPKLSNTKSPTQDQNGLVPVIQSDGLQSLWWSSSSRYLTFFEGTDYAIKNIPSGTTDKSQWWLYDSAKNDLINQGNWPQSILVGQTVASTPPPSDASFIWESPSGAYVIYGTDASETATSSIYLYSRRENKTQQLVLGPNGLNVGGTESLTVNWSKDESSLLLTSKEDGGNFQSFYISGYKQSVAQLVLLSLQNIQIEGEKYNIEQVYDLSLDGTQILIKAVNVTSGEIVLSRAMLLPEISGEIISKNAKGILDAAFMPNEKTVILIIGQDQLYRLNLATKNTTTILTNIIFNDAVKVAFSPDRSKVALISALPGDNTNNLYILTTVDGKMIPIPQTVMQPTKSLGGVSITFVCASSDGKRYWKAENPNAEALNLVYEVLNSTPQRVGNFTLPGTKNGVHGELTIKTTKVNEPDTLVFYLGEKVIATIQSTQELCAAQP